MKTLGTLPLVFVLALTASATADEGAKPGTFSSTDKHASSCKKKTLSDWLQFASADRASTILGKKDDWARQLSAFDLGVRQQTAQPTRLHEFLDFASEAALEWTPEERASWGAMIDKLSYAMEGLGVDLPKIDLVKTTGEEEFDAAYTRQRAIMFPQRLAGLAATQPRNAFFLLAHELFHALSRNDSDLRDKTYALLGANRFDEIEFPAELEERRLSNPDAHTYEHAVTVQTASGNADVVPVIQSLVPLEEAILLPNFFDALDIILLAVDTRTSRVLRNSNGTLISYTFGNTNWVPLMRRNSNFIIHPEEVLADNFATLMEWRANGVLPVTNAVGFTINDIALLVSIEQILADGCGK